MKTKRLERYFLSIAITAFLVLLTGNAFAANQNASRNGAVATGDNRAQDHSNNYIVASPYWQVDSGSYTFIAISHNSLSGMASQIGITINAITSAGAAYDTAESFTITSGNTQRVFIVPTGHATINPTSITTAKYLQGTTGFTYGHLRVNPVATHPQLKRGGNVLAKFARGHGDGFRDATMLTYWGSVIIEANTTGFAMEFIGDMNDSTSSAGQEASISTSGVNLL